MADNDIMKRLKELEAQVSVFGRFVDDGGLDDAFLVKTKKELASTLSSIKKSKNEEFTGIEDALDDLLSETSDKGTQRLIKKVKTALLSHNKKIDKSIKSITAETVFGFEQEAKEIEKSVNRIMTTFSQMDAIDAIMSSKTTEALDGMSKTIENNILNVKDDLMRMKQETEEKFAEFPEKIRLDMVEPIEKELFKLGKASEKVARLSTKHRLEIEKGWVGTLEKMSAGFSKFRTALSEIKIMEIADQIAEAGETFLALRRRITKRFGLTNKERESMRDSARQIQAAVNYQISAAEAMETQVKIMESGITDKAMAAAFAEAAEKVKITTDVDLSEMEDVLIAARQMGDETGKSLVNIGNTLNALKKAGQMKNTDTVKLGNSLNEAAAGFMIASNGNMEVYNKMMSQLAASDSALAAQGFSEGTLSKIMGAIASKDVEALSGLGLAGAVQMKELIDQGDAAGAARVFMENLDRNREMLLMRPSTASELGLDMTNRNKMALTKYNKGKTVEDLDARLKTIEDTEGMTEAHIDEHSMSSLFHKLGNWFSDNPLFLWMKDWDIAEDVTLKDIMKGISYLQMGVDGILFLMGKDQLFNFFTKGMGKRFFRGFSKGGLKGLGVVFRNAIMKPLGSFGKTLFSGLGSGLSKTLGPTMTNFFSGVFSFVRKGFTGLFDILKGWAKPLTDGFMKLIQKLPGFSTVIEWIGKKALSFGEWMSGLGKWGSSFAKALGIGSKITSGFGTMLMKVGGKLLGVFELVWDFVSGLFSSMENIGADGIGGMLASGIGKLIGGGEGGIGNAISNALKWGMAGTLVGGPVGAVVGGIGGLIFGGVGGDSIGNFLYHHLSFESKDEEKARLAKRNQARAEAGSHAGGLSEVPYDNYPAFLHKGEAVLTADQAGAVRHALPSDGGLPSISAFFDSINPFAMRTAEAASHTGSLLARIAENTGDLKAIQEEYNEDSLELMEKRKTFGEGGENSLSALDKQNMKMEKKAQERQQKSFFDKLKEGFQKGGVPGALGAIGEQAANLGRDIYNRAFGGGAAGKDVSALPGGQIAMAISGKTGLPAELIWAQLYHETGGFDSELATKYHNYGGVKGAGNEIGSDERGHSYFASDQDFIDYYSNYILKYAEDGIGIKNAKTAAQWASVLKAGGYYTDDEANYAASMQGILDAHASQMKELQSGSVLSKVAGTFQMAAQTLSNNCTVTAINAIEKFYTGVASAAEDGFSTAWGTLEGKLNATEYDFDVNEFPEFDKTLRNLLAGGQERPMAFYMTGGAGDEGNHILNAHSGNHMVVITRMMPDGTFEVQDPQDGSTQYLRSDQIFDATARGGTQGMGAGEGNALFVPNIYTAAMGEWEVQNDGDMYKLHAGEMVLPPEAAESMRAMLQGGANAPIQPIPDIESIKESLREANPNMSEAQINAMARRTAQVNAYRQELTNGVPLHEGVNRVSGTVGGSGLQQDQLDALKKVADEAKARGESIDVREAFRRANQSVDMTDRTLNAEDREKLDAIREFRQNNPFKQAAENKQELTEAVAKGCQEGCQQGVEEGLPETKPEIAPTRDEIPTVPTKPEIAPTKNEIPTVPTRPPMATAGGGFGGGLAQNRNLPSNDILQRLMNPNGGFMGRGGAGSIMDILRTPGIFGGGQSPLQNLPFNIGGGLPGIIGTIFGRTGISGTRWGGALQSVLQNIFGGGNVQSMITGVLGNFNTGRYSNLVGTGINALGSLIGGYFERGRKKKEAILATAQKDQFGNITNLKDMPNELRITEKDSKEIAADKFKKQQELYYAQEKALQKVAQAKADADKKNAESNANITETTDKEKQLAQAAITESKQEAKEIARPVTEPSAVAENAAMAEQKAAAATQQTTAAQTRTNLNTVSPPSPAVQQVEAQTELGTGASVVDAIKWAVGRMEAKSDQIITAIGANGGGTTNNMFNQEHNPGYDMMRVLGTAFRF